MKLLLNLIVIVVIVVAIGLIFIVTLPAFGNPVIAVACFAFLIWAVSRHG